MIVLRTDAGQYITSPIFMLLINSMFQYLFCKNCQNLLRYWNLLVVYWRLSCTRYPNSCEPKNVYIYKSSSCKLFNAQFCCSVTQSYLYVNWLTIYKTGGFTGFFLCVCTTSENCKISGLFGPTSYSHFYSFWVE